MIYIINEKLVEKINETTKFEFPKYTTQLINLANQNSGGTRPKVVGQLSDLFPEFVSSGAKVTPNNWKIWYENKFPENKKIATQKILDHIQNLKEAITLIDEEMVEKWVEDLITYKTYNGIYIQKTILAFLAEKEKTNYRMATPDEEAKGIDGYVGNVPYSIKPYSYKSKMGLPETIDVKMIYYKKENKKWQIDVEE